MLSVAHAFVPLAPLLVNAKDTLAYRGAGRHRRAHSQGLLEPHSNGPFARILPHRAAISANDVVA
jgi:hypothetical protein